MSIFGRLFGRGRKDAQGAPAPAAVARRFRPYGMIAEFDDPDQLIAAANRAREVGYRQMDAFTPFPVHGLDEAIGFKGTILPVLVLLGGVAGLLGGFLLQYYGMAVDYPFNVGGRPLNSWPSFIPITFETMILGAVFTAVFGMLALNGLPQPYHPVFGAPNFELASRSHFFLCIEATDKKYDSSATRRFLESMEPRSVAEVER
jgi:hypothetical protein